MAARQSGCPIGADQHRRCRPAVAARSARDATRRAGSRCIPSPPMRSAADGPVGGARRRRRPTLSPTIRCCRRSRPRVSSPACQCDVDGLPIGTVSVVDHRPRTLDGESTRSAGRPRDDGRVGLRSTTERAAPPCRREDRARAASRTGTDWLWETDAAGRADLDLRQRRAAHRLAGQPRDWRAQPAHQPAAPGPSARELGAIPSGTCERHEPFRDAIAERDSAHGTMLVAISGEPLFDADRCLPRLHRLRPRRHVHRRGARAGSALAAAAAEDHRRRARRRDDQRPRRSRAHEQRGLASEGRSLRAGRRPHLGAARAAAWCSRGVYPGAVGREEEFIAWRLAIASPEATLHEVRFVDQDALVSDQRLPDGTVIHLSLDITERRRAEREVMRQRAELESLAGAHRGRPAGRARPVVRGRPQRPLPALQRRPPPLAGAAVRADARAALRVRAAAARGSARASNRCVRHARPATCSASSTS